MPLETRYERDRGEAMKAFLRRFRHEISTPLSGANLHLEVALRRMQKGGGFDLAAVVENLRTCQQSLESAAEMLELIAEAARQEAEGPAEFSLLESLERAAAPLRNEARSRGLMLDLPDPAAGPAWFGSAREVESVFSELTRNAVLHSSPPGTIRWTVEDGRGETVLVCRSPGRLPPGDPEHLFGVAKGAASTGRGFGLLRARRAIQSNGGELTFSQEGDDVCAALRFPPREG
jgi:signal transduction histidine kinase